LLRKYFSNYAASLHIKCTAHRVCAVALEVARNEPDGYFDAQSLEEGVVVDIKA